MLDVAACRSIELAVVPFGTSRSPILKVMVALLGMTPTQPWCCRVGRCPIPNHFWMLTEPGSAIMRFRPFFRCLTEHRSFICG